MFYNTLFQEINNNLLTVDIALFSFISGSETVTSQTVIMVHAIRPDETEIFSCMTSIQATLLHVLMFCGNKRPDR